AFLHLPGLQASGKSEESSPATVAGAAAVLARVPYTLRLAGSIAPTADEKQLFAAPIWLPRGKPSEAIFPRQSLRDAGEENLGQDATSPGRYRGTKIRARLSPLFLSIEGPPCHYRSTISRPISRPIQPKAKSISTTGPAITGWFCSRTPRISPPSAPP